MAYQTSIPTLIKLTKRIMKTMVMVINMEYLKDLMEMEKEMGIIEMKMNTMMSMKTKLTAEMERITMVMTTDYHPLKEVVEMDLEKMTLELEIEESDLKLLKQRKQMIVKIMEKADQNGI